MEILPYETEIFYDKYGLRVWEKRHSKVLSILNKKKDFKKAKKIHFLNCFVFTFKILIYKVLDIGCDKGIFLKKASRELTLELLVGLDISKQALIDAQMVKF